MPKHTYWNTLLVAWFLNLKNRNCRAVSWNIRRFKELGRQVRVFARALLEVFKMGRGILLWLLGIPLPIVILLVLFLR